MCDPVGIEIIGQGDRSPQHAGVLDDPSLGVLQRLLLASDGTTVGMLEVYFDEPVRVDGLVQSYAQPSSSDAELEPSDHETILRRTAFIQGGHTGRNYLHADSRVVLDRLPLRVREGLLSGSEPIGRLLTVNRIETYRQTLRTGKVRAEWLGAGFGVEWSEQLLFRTYRIISGGRPIILITECFPAG